MINSFYSLVKNTYEDVKLQVGFARFNTIITCLKALDEGFSSKNYVTKFLRALHPKWRAKVTEIEESKDLSSLALDELIGNLKVHEVIMKKDFEIYRGKKEIVKSIALKAKKESSDDETSTSRSNDDEYAMIVRNFQKFFRRKGKFVRQPREEKKSFRQRDEKKGKSDLKCFRCGNPNHLIDDCPKPPRNKNQKAFIGGSWSDSENNAEDKTNDETCLMDQSSNEVTLNSSYYSDNTSSFDSDTMQIEYDSLCEISLNIINKNKILKTKSDLLEKEILELNEKIKKLERSKEIDITGLLAGIHGLFSGRYCGLDRRVTYGYPWPRLEGNHRDFAMPSHFHKKFRWGTVFATGRRSFIEPGTGHRMKRTNRWTRVLIGLYPCHIKEKRLGETTEEEVEENEGLKEVWEQMEYVISDSDSDLESTAKSEVTQPTTIQSAILTAAILTDEAVHCGTLTKGNDKRKEIEESNVTLSTRRMHLKQATGQARKPLALEGNRNTQNNGNQTRGRAFNRNAVEALQDPKVVTGTFSLNNQFATVLFDSGANFSFISTKFAPFLNVEPCIVNPGYVIEVPDGESVEVDKIIHNCKLEIGNSLFTIDLIPLGHGSFDVVVWIDWLSKNKVVIACHEKVVEIPIKEGRILQVHGERTLGAAKALMNAKIDEPRISDIPVVRDFTDVFLKDLSGLPP
ncbi:zf-CCHC domain-containing protein [Tanacetum coccineum]|uniref:Zf-CCHC domain-containing protein n=1 Tax=Tanacetum coccineum TaxID=301880 RepID=A0ABQ5C1P5_9ASTR